MSELDYYAVSAVSNSGMSLINIDQGGTRKKYKRFVVDKESRDEDTPTLKNGRIIHKYMEDPASFVVSDTVKPSNMMCSWVEDIYDGCRETFENIDPIDLFAQSNPTGKNCALEYRTTQYKAMVDDDKLYAKFIKEGFDYLLFLHKTDGKIIMDLATKRIVEGAINGIKSNPEACELLFTAGTGMEDCAYSELPIYWNERVHNLDIPCKSLIDRVRIFPKHGYVQLVDGKTTSRPVTMFHESFRKFRYYRQLAFYKLALTRFLEKEYPDIKEWDFHFSIIAVETTGLFECIVYEIDKHWIDEGEIEYDRLLREIASCTYNNDWETVKRYYLDYEKE